MIHVYLHAVYMYICDGCLFEGAVYSRWAFISLVVNVGGGVYLRAAFIFEGGVYVRWEFILLAVNVGGGVYLRVAFN